MSAPRVDFERKKKFTSAPRVDFKEEKFIVGPKG